MGHLAYSLCTDRNDFRVPLSVRLRRTGEQRVEILSGESEAGPLGAPQAEAFALEALVRLSLTGQDNVRYRLKTPNRDAATRFVFEPYDPFALGEKAAQQRGAAVLERMQ